MNFVDRVTAAYRLVAYLAMAFLVCAMLVTVIDVALRRSANLPILGTIDLVQLFVVSAAYLSIPYVFMVDGHVSIDVITKRLPLRLRYLVHAIGFLLALGIMALVGYYSWQQALLKLEAGDVSQNISIPVIYYWAPLVAGCALSVASSVLVLVRFGLYALFGGQEPALSHDDPGV